MDPTIAATLFLGSLSVLLSLIRFSLEYIEKQKDNKETKIKLEVGDKILEVDTTDNESLDKLLSELAARNIQVKVTKVEGHNGTK